MLIRFVFSIVICLVFSYPAGAITFRFETIAAKGDVSFDATIVLSELVDTRASARRDDVGVFDLSSEPGFEQLSIDYQGPLGLGQSLVLTPLSFVSAFPTIEDVALNIRFRGVSALSHVGLDIGSFGFLADAPSFLDIWTARFATDDTSGPTATVIGRFVAVPEPGVIGFILLALSLMLRERSRRVGRSASSKFSMPSGPGTD